MGQILNYDDPFVQELKVGYPAKSVLVLPPNFNESVVTAIDAAEVHEYTAAEILTQFIQRDPNGNDRDDVAPTGAAIIAALGDLAQVGYSFIFTIQNTADGAEYCYLDSVTGTTVVGYQVIGQGVTGTFLCRVDSATAVTIYRIK